MLGCGHHYPSLNIGALFRHLLNQRHEVGVGEHVLIVGVIDDVDNLLGEKSRVDRVANVARAGRRIIGFQMPVVVPGQRRDSIAALQAPCGDRVCQLPATLEGVSIGVAMTRVIPSDRHDLFMPVNILRVANDRRDR